MGTTLTDKIVADTYDGLIKVTDNNVITGTKKRLTDGFGNDLPILVSTTDFQVDGTLVLGGTTAQYVRGDGSIATFPTLLSSDKLVTEVYNSSGATLTKGTIVYINGTQGNLPTIAKALATGDSTSAQTFGFVQNDITNMNNGYVIVAGKLSDLNTSAYTGGTQLYLSPTTAGTYTPTKPYAPNHLVYVGIVVRAHPTQGIIEVKIQNGYELDELHDVSAQSPSNNDGIFYNSTSTLWEKKSIATALGFTPVPTTRTISTTAPLSGGGDLSANRTLSISQANTSTNGFLSSTDWNTFNSKVPSTRTLTINGTAYDLSADRSWTIAGGLSGSGTTNYVAKFTGTSAIGNSQIFDNGTNVGIGTTTPFEKVQIGNGSATSGQYLRIWNSNSDIYIGQSGGTIFGLPTGNGYYILGDNASYPFGIGTTASQPFILATANTERIRINTAGNLGIGTTSPSEKLSVKSADAAIKLEGTTNSYLFQIVDANNRLRIFDNTNNVERITLTSAGNVGIGTTSPGGLLDINSSTGNDRLLLSYSGSVKAGFGVTTAGVAYMYHHTSSTFPMWISATGNFGIGTTSPTAKLSVAGDINLLSTGAGIGCSTESVYFGGTTNGNYLAFGTNNAERMRIANNGNASLGDTLTLSPPSWYGTLTLGKNGTDKVVVGYVASTTNGAVIGGHNSALNAWADLNINGQNLIFRNAETERMRVASTGNVLIGSATDNSTTAKLQVTGGISYQNIFNAQGGTTYTLALTDQSKIIEMQNGGANNVTIPLDSSVNFPIGTEIQVLQLGTGQTTIVATSGVTTRSKSGQIKIANQNTGVTLVKRAANDWYIIGNLTA